MPAQSWSKWPFCCWKMTLPCRLLPPPHYCCCCCCCSCLGCCCCFRGRPRRVRPPGPWSLPAIGRTLSSGRRRRRAKRCPHVRSRRETDEEKTAWGRRWIPKKHHLLVTALFSFKYPFRTHLDYVTQPYDIRHITHHSRQKSPTNTSLHPAPPRFCLECS